MMTRAGPSQSPDLDGAPIAPRVTLPRRKYMTQVPGSKLTFSLRIVCWARLMASFEISVHRRHPESLNLRGHRRRETVPLIVRTKCPLNLRVSSTLETIVV